jgi:hypothetical protein
MYDTCLFRETNAFIRDVQAGKADFSQYGVMNMLNVKYIVFGPDRTNIIPNPSANGNAWFVNEVVTVNSPTEEVQKTCGVNTRTTAVVDASKFKVEGVKGDTAASIQLTDYNPNLLLMGKKLRLFVRTIYCVHCKYRQVNISSNLNLNLQLTIPETKSR